MFRKPDNLKDEYLKAFKVVVTEFESLSSLIELSKSEHDAFQALQKIIQSLEKAEDAHTQLALINAFHDEKDKFITLLKKRKESL